MLNRTMTVWLAGLWLAACAGTSAGQVYSGSYKTPGGVTVRWTIRFGQGHVNVSADNWIREGFQEVIEGGEGELEAVEGEAAEVEDGGEYHVIDYARDLLAGRYSAQLAEVADTMRERGGDRLPGFTRAELLEETVGAYGMHLSAHPEDWIAVREMGVALLEAGRIEDAMNMVHEAYLQNPELGILPLSPGLLGESSKEAVRKLVVRAVQQTNREPSAKGWLLVAVLMQSEGRVELAGEMVGRAERLGLEKEIVEGMRAALP